MLRILVMLMISMTTLPGMVGRAAAEEDRPLRMFVGTYTWGTSRGIYLVELDTKLGRLSAPRLVVEMKHPTFLNWHPKKSILYAVCELPDAGGKDVSTVAGFAVDEKTLALTPLNRQSSGGAGACFVQIDPSGRAAIVANYSDGTVAALGIDAGGMLRAPASVLKFQGTGPDPKRQESPHAHCAVLDPSGKFIISCDLGTDEVRVLKLNAAEATLTPNDPPSARVKPGAGPRHAVFHTNGKFLYVVNELDNTLNVFAWSAAAGTLKPVETISTLPAGSSDESYCSEVAMHPGGRFLYAANRGHDSLAIFGVEASTGKLSPRGHVSTGGKFPGHFAIDPSGRFVVVGNQNSDNLVLFHVEQSTGALSPAGSSVEIGAPVCIRFVER